MRTKRYIAVMEGEGPGTSRTLLATADPSIVSKVLDVIRERTSDDYAARRMQPVSAGAE